MAKLSIVWMRRNLRIEDNKVMHEALSNSDQILPIFIFDTTILAKFPNPQDRRLSFIANILHGINTELSKKFDGELTVFHGDPVKIVPKLAKLLNVSAVYADEDFEPENIERDEKVKSHLNKNQRLELLVDHLLVRPGEILKGDGTPYRKFTPYMKAYKEYLASNKDDVMAKYTYQLKGKITDADLPKDSTLKLVDLDGSPDGILKQIGYEYREDDLWHPSKAKRVLADFVSKKIKDYRVNRNFMSIDGTSTLSPYIRFGVISIRECLSKAYPFKRTEGGDQWINELIWREWYVDIIHNFPDCASEEFLEKYRGKIKWAKNEVAFAKFCEGRTGFPIVDASVRQLLQDGWMHNRGRMIVSNFLTKNLLIDWRDGEEFFSQHLMDYDLASNVGGWQWSSSVGTDAQPYFRVFNPWLQAVKYDPDGLYIKRYVPELSKATSKQIHSTDVAEHFPDYPRPIVDYAETRAYAISVFRGIS